MAQRIILNADVANEFTDGMSSVAEGLKRHAELAEKYGIPDLLGMTAEEWRMKRLGGYKQNQIKERREKVKRLSKTGLNGSEIAKVLGVSPMTISRDNKKLTTLTLDDEKQNKINGNNNIDTENVIPLKKSIGRPRKGNKQITQLSDPIQVPCIDCNTIEEHWERSFSNLAGDAISMSSYWARQFGDWKQFNVPTHLVTLAEQAAKAWARVASDMRKRRQYYESEHQEAEKGI